MIIYLMRHGETEWNKEKKLQGQSDIPLNPYGIKLAEITSEALSSVSFDWAFSSPLSRAEKTAEIMCRGRELPIQTDDRLKEFNFGIAEGLYFSEVTRAVSSPIHDCFYHPAAYRKAVEGGETIDEIESRTMDFMNRSIKPLEKKCGNILVVCHGGVIRAIINSIRHTPPEMFWDSVSEGNCAVNLIECTGGRFRILETDKIYYYEETDRKGIL